MKRTYIFIITAIVAAMGALVACHENIIDETIDYEIPIEAYANMNPDEPIILSVNNDKGESVILMGTKSNSGHAESLQQMIINLPEEEAPTEVFFNENEQLQEIIASNGVRFQFDWLSETEAALTLIDPNTNEQLNTLIDLSNPVNDIQANNTRSISNTPRKGNSTLTIKPQIKVNEQLGLLSTRSSNGRIGNVYLEQCGAPTVAQCWVNVYDYSDLSGSFGRGKYRGRFPCTQVGEGHYQFNLPTNYNEHHNIADYCDAISSVISKICGINAWTAPGSGAKQAMCYAISGALASGIVSAPVAAGFASACLSISTALDAGCSLVNGNMDLPEGSPDLVDGLCGLLREMDYTWDTPLLLQPVVNALPTCIYGTAQIYEANTAIKDMKVTWGGKPAINSFKLDPSAPAEGVSYLAIAKLSCLPPGTQVIMDIIGTDGYSDTQTSSIGSDSNLNYTATLHVPGAESGVRDVCTVTVITQDGETITKKASLVFH